MDIFAQRDEILQNISLDNEHLTNNISNNIPTNLNDLCENLESLLIKELKNTIEIKYTQKYIDNNMVPRGLRLKKNCTFTLNEELSNEWFETLENASLGLMKIIIKSRNLFLKDIKSEIDSHKNNLKSFENNIEFTNLQKDIFSNISKFKDNIIETKLSKYQRDLRDYSDNKPETDTPIETETNYDIENIDIDTTTSKKDLSQIFGKNNHYTNRHPKTNFPPKNKEKNHNYPNHNNEPIKTFYKHSENSNHNQHPNYSDNHRQNSNYYHTNHKEQRDNAYNLMRFKENRNDNGTPKHNYHQQENGYHVDRRVYSHNNYDNDRENISNRDNYNYSWRNHNSRNVYSGNPNFRNSNFRDTNRTNYYSRNGEYNTNNNYHSHQQQNHFSYRSQSNDYNYHNRNYSNINQDWRVPVKNRFQPLETNIEPFSPIPNQTHQQVFLGKSPSGEGTSKNTNSPTLPQRTVRNKRGLEAEGAEENPGKTPKRQK
ncbi:GATA zinc finger domain-containing protein 14-like [Bombina bombina]|uniref:GATA zinc finger domain-containing protein 14-like n=1 Tax=Bombina bombina TaxID=8345 RepID=UPI00235A80BB|nr:GATA zinc finger domain-containing protein 14-like [Bombina bombina]